MGIPDLVYARPPGFRPLTLDLYVPPRQSRGQKLPLVVYVHGGAWRGGTSRLAGAFTDFPAVLSSLAARGYVVASINYRLSEEAPYPAPVEDLLAAIRFLKENAVPHGIDPDRLILWGSSAGGQIAALAGVTCQTDGVACARAVVVWYGIFDLETLEPAERSAASPTSAYLGCDPRRCVETARAASPVNHIDASDPPFLILHGTGDDVVPAEQSRAMERRLQALGIMVESEFFAGIGHSWIAATPGATRQVSLNALARTFEFIERRAAR